MRIFSFVLCTRERHMFYIACSQCNRALNFARLSLTMCESMLVDWTRFTQWDYLNLEMHTPTTIKWLWNAVTLEPTSEQDWRASPLLWIWFSEGFSDPRPMLHILCGNLVTPRRIYNIHWGLSTRLLTQPWANYIPPWANKSFWHRENEVKDVKL